MTDLCAKGLRLVVFDFDNTLSVVHVFKALAGWQHNGDEFAVPGPFATSERGQIRRIAELSEAEFKDAGGFAHVAFGGEDRIEMVRQLLQGLHDEGTEMIVCSKGLVGAVKMCLQKLELDHFFSAIYGNIGGYYGMGAFDNKIACELVRESSAALMGKEAVLQDRGSKAALIQELMSARNLRHHQCILVEDDPRETNAAKGICTTLLVEDAAGITKQHVDKLLAMASKDSIRKVFEKFDVDGDNRISETELRQVLRKTCGQAMSEDSITSILHGSGLARNGFLQYHEFVDWVFQGGANHIGSKWETLDLAAGTAGSDLLEGWTQHVDPATGHIFFYNASTGESTWAKPRASDALPVGWTEHVDAASERSFYHNTSTGETTWVNPRATSLEHKS